MLIDDEEYSVGVGVIIKVDHKYQFGCIHFFFENPSPDIDVNRRMVAVELFYKPKQIRQHINIPVKIHDKFEVR